MSISSKLASLFKSFDDKKKNKIIKMAWDNKTTYKEIKKLFDLSPNEVEKFMRFHSCDKDFLRWKKNMSKKFSLKSKKAQIRIAND